MRRFCGLLLVLLLVMPVTVSAQEATPSALSDPWIVGDGLTDLASLDYETFNGAAIVGTLAAWDDPLLLVAFRNDSSQTLYQAMITVEARTADGALFAVAETSSLYPFVVEPGAYAFGYAEFSDIKSLVGLNYSLGWEANKEVGPMTKMINLRIGEVQKFSDRIVGIATNEGSAIDGKASVVVMCFDRIGDLVQFSRSPTSRRSLAPGGYTPFQIALDPELGCSRYLLVATWANFIIWG